MRGSIVAIVVIVVVIGVAGYIAVKDPTLLSFKSSPALPETSPGLRIPAASELNSTTGTSWYEVMNLTVGVSNLSSLDNALSNISDTEQYVQSVQSTAPYFHISYAQGALFLSANKGLMALAYASFTSASYANLTNSSLFGNITKTKVSNLSYGEVSGAFYVFGYQFANGNYSSGIYALYSNYIIIALYHGENNITKSTFTSIVSTEVDILTSYQFSFRAAERLIQTSNITDQLGTSYKPDFNFSLFVISHPQLLEEYLDNYTSGSYNSTYSQILNMSRNTSSNVGIAATAFSSSKSVYVLGYLKGTNSMFAAKEYLGIQEYINSSLKDFGKSISNISFNGGQFFIYNFSYQFGSNYTLSVGHIGDYLVFEIDLGSSTVGDPLTALMEEEMILLQ
ncbi:hypothetical protein ApAK_07780 [Thermoplasmatales archaeon AK]|nr:hypothetical protein [Thermoplasmatales archaeon AK]